MIKADEWAGKPVRDEDDARYRRGVWAHSRGPVHRYRGEEAWCRLCGQPGDGTGRHGPRAADPGAGLGDTLELLVLRMTPRLREVLAAALERAYYHPGGSGPAREDYRWAQGIVAEAHPHEET